MKWRVYYSNETTFDSARGEPKDAPGLGVIVIVLKHKDKRRKHKDKIRNQYQKRRKQVSRKIDEKICLAEKERQKLKELGERVKGARIEEERAKEEKRVKKETR